MMLRSAAAASSSVFPGALRIISNAFAAHSPHQHSIISNNFCSEPKNSTDRKLAFAKAFFSTGAENSTDDRTLAKALKSEIKSFKAPSPPDDFPFTIETEEKYGVPEKKTAGLRRELNGEKIYVSVAMPEVICTSSAGSVCLYISIGKPNGKFIDFGARMCPHIIHVDMMSVMEPSPQSPDEFRCLGTHDVEAEGELQFSLQEYLKIRGVVPSYTEFMYKYMVSLALAKKE